MGVNLRDLFPQHPLPPGWLDGKRVAVDGHNVAYRYLTSFRGRDGDLLRAPDGRAIGHLIGYANLVRHLRERGAEPVVVWDGSVHERKRRTVDERRRVVLRRLAVPLLALVTRFVGSKRGTLGIGRYRKKDLALIKDLVEAGKYRPVIDRVYPMDDYVEAARYVESGQKTGSVVIRVTGALPVG